MDEINHIRYALTLVAIILILLTIGVVKNDNSINKLNTKIESIQQNDK